MGKPQKAEMFSYISKAAVGFLKAFFMEDFHSHFLGTRKMVRFELIPWHCQLKSFIARTDSH